MAEAAIKTARSKAGTTLHGRTQKELAVPSTRAASPRLQLIGFHTVEKKHWSEFHGMRWKLSNGFSQK